MNNITIDYHAHAISSIYWNVSPDYKRPPFEGINRCIKTDNHAPGILIEYK